MPLPRQSPGVKSSSSDRVAFIACVHSQSCVGSVAAIWGHFLRAARRPIPFELPRAISFGLRPKHRTRSSPRDMATSRDNSHVKLWPLLGIAMAWRPWPPFASLFCAGSESCQWAIPFELCPKHRTRSSPRDMAATLHFNKLNRKTTDMCYIFATFSSELAVAKL